MLYAKICREVEVNAPASALWEVHSTLQLNDAVRKDYGHLYEKVEVLEGDGSAGTIVRFVFQPGICTSTLNPAIKNKLEVVVLE